MPAQKGAFWLGDDRAETLVREKIRNEGFLA
jgi:hypothetical protein